jgi:hypothetical protein
MRPSFLSSPSLGYLLEMKSFGFSFFGLRYTFAILGLIGWLAPLPTVAAGAADLCTAPREAAVYRCEAIYKREPVSVALCAVPMPLERASGALQLRLRTATGDTRKFPEMLEPNLERFRVHKDGLAFDVDKVFFEIIRPKAEATQGEQSGRVVLLVGSNLPVVMRCIGEQRDELESIRSLLP